MWTKLAVALLSLVAVGMAQSPPAAPPQAVAITPESGFVSTDRYTNAFMSGSQSGLDELKNTKILFATTSPAAAGTPER
jgi:hypothetical protein